MGAGRHSHQLRSDDERFPLFSVDILRNTMNQHLCQFGDNTPSSTYTGPSEIKYPSCQASVASGLTSLADRSCCDDHLALMKGLCFASLMPQPTPYIRSTPPSSLCDECLLHYSAAPSPRFLSQCWCCNDDRKHIADVLCQKVCDRHRRGVTIAEESEGNTLENGITLPQLPECFDYLIINFLFQFNEFVQKLLRFGKFTGALTSTALSTL